MTTVVDRAFLDTNVLVAATDEGRAEHRSAVALLEQWPVEGSELYTSGQVLREYLAVATRPLERNGLGMTRADALLNVRALRDRTLLLDETSKVTERLLLLLETIECGGKQVHAANVVATMLAHGIETLVTINVRDFERFASEISIVELS